MWCARAEHSKAFEKRPIFVAPSVVEVEGFAELFHAGLLEGGAYDVFENVRVGYVNKRERHCNLLIGCRRKTKGTVRITNPDVTPLTAHWFVAKEFSLHKNHAVIAK
jgi:hypothetical protein